MKAFLNPALDEVHLVTAIHTDEGRIPALSRQRELLEPGLADNVHHHIVPKEDEYTLYESLGRHVATAVRPHLIFMSSTALCTNPPPPPSSVLGLIRSSSASGAAPGGGGPGAGLGGGGGSGLSGLSGVLGASSVALKILPELRCAPVLLAKYNSKGGWLAAAMQSASAGQASWLSGGASLASTGRPGSSGGGMGMGSSMLDGAGEGLGSERTSPQFGRISADRPSPQFGRGSGGTPPAAPASLAGALNGGPSSGSLLSGMGASTGSLAGTGRSSRSLSAPDRGASTPMRLMVDLHANSRAVLDWLFEHFSTDRDHLVLTVSQAYDEKNNVRPAATRLLTAFGVQAAVNGVHSSERTLLAGHSSKALPGAVADASPDLLVLQTPRCKGIPASMQELLYGAKTSFLIWPPDYDPAH
ncbi:hypothetical protein HYH03_016290 [Edaphochlamys debaryana]|uniref:Uncharacterized protein n=1 Tax=Edaphochlamys debaryana TaxID=47281 RepID=A0A835XK32_9CHLO|nr:hypothetical protein HYH03_016290 [Edaphochlamys debaryana]|eukprot:KAG2484904.1 hypothetical protein HYH03_016290 [Edaphochlamys debaryana]